MEILHAASQMASTSRRGKSQIRFQIAGPSKKSMRLNSGIRLTPDVALADLATPDLLILPAIWRTPLPTLRESKALIARLPDIAASGTKICSVGTASCLLAEAGILNGRPATTHWNYFDRFAKRYPEVDLKTRHLITQSDNIYCVGSVNSIADLMVHLVEERFGSRIARAIETQFSPEIRLPFGATSYQKDAASSHHDETVLEGQQWIQDHLSTSINMAALAAHLQLSARTMNRRFTAATGVAPKVYLQRLRMTTAKDLLRNSNLSINEVAWQVGLHDVSYFSALFKAQIGMPPLKYRQAVRGKLFAVSETAGSTS
ncbi:MAG: transcriptional regulator GlxA family with amidase domain [Halioglobus sp.]|jgi:transcriptional regulator GlxA family with amidase domain